ncbi:response regulator [Solidesulfovibrio magneticus]|uniref:Chemotaxis protein CheY n=1 Tax=Solidesulfovibrio magneticus (strain ATCC 700980 / DSM 13731 / RS-1) TaxID=573370 RepID=C4XKZ0_SOLM1|nr:response regulator [Solidesulfovibrio magneticus]BAH74529.1 chemotaxis protein CheY [Solidesulfovibrio magneticus RS-1]
MNIAKLRILVVDDFSTMRKIIKSMLRKIGVKSIDDAEDGKIALNLINIHTYDLIILDWNMPNMSGIDLLKSIKKDQKPKYTPVLMVTSEATEPQIITAVQAGASNYIVKPFTEATLTKKLCAILNIGNNI